MLRRVLPLLVVLLLVAACGGGGAQTPAGGNAPAGNASNGDKLFHATSLGKNNAPGCTSCHSTEAGKTLVGPSLAGIGTRAGQIIQDPNYKGKAKTADDFIRESIVEPNTYVEKSFSPGVMYQNYGKDLSQQEISDLVAYLTSLK
jgi:cytochrome c2